MKPVKKNVRMKSLTMETSAALHRTCTGLREIAIHLLTTKEDYRQEYVLLGHFQGDYIEELFGHYRQRCGGNYYISVQQVLQTARIDHAKTIISANNLDVNFFTDISHKCSFCTEEMSEADNEVMEKLEQLRCALSKDVQLTMVFIAGCG